MHDPPQQAGGDCGSGECGEDEREWAALHVQRKEVKGCGGVCTGGHSGVATFPARQARGWEPGIRAKHSEPSGGADAESSAGYGTKDLHGIPPDRRTLVLEHEYGLSGACPRLVRGPPCLITYEARSQSDGHYFPVCCCGSDCDGFHLFDSVCHQQPPRRRTRRSRALRFETS